jgi:ABC-type bacteriocin/lantibiotic exporter with double-glycine peptidase domain
MASQANSSIYHDVPFMLQPQSWACWYTSFQMVLAYQRSRGRAGGLKDPAQVKWIKDIYDANQGIGKTADEREKVARALGFQVYYASVNADGLWGLLLDAPVIYAGRWPGQSSGHFVVLTGISGTTLSINNPATKPETYDYNWFAGQVLLQTGERPLIYP